MRIDRWPIQGSRYPTTAPTLETSMTNVQLVEALHEIWCTGDASMIDQIYAPDFVGHWPRSSEVPLRLGIQTLRLGLQRTRMAFPDWHERVVDVFGSGDKVATRYVSTGTHLGPYLGMSPTGRRI